MAKHCDKTIMHTENLTISAQNLLNLLNDERNQKSRLEMRQSLQNSTSCKKEVWTWIFSPPSRNLKTPPTGLQRSRCKVPSGKLIQNPCTFKMCKLVNWTWNFSDSMQPYALVQWSYLQPPSKFAQCIKFKNSGSVNLKSSETRHSGR